MKKGIVLRPPLVPIALLWIAKRIALVMTAPGSVASWSAPCTAPVTFVPHSIASKKCAAVAELRVRAATASLEQRVGGA
eukprot:1202518-Alexandrium_andersonii.AAC.1